MQKFFQYYLVCLSRLRIAIIAKYLNRHEI